MKSYLNSEGSAWSRWDLHVHSPSSKLSNQFGTWDEYINALEMLEEDIKVIGITDYYSIEGYLKVLKCKEEGRLKNIDLILPNVELRIDTVTTRDRPINIHVLFNPEIAEHIEDKFFRELKYQYNDTTFTCTNNDLMRLGREIKSEGISDEEAIKEGMNQFKVSVDKLEHIFIQNKSIFENNKLIVVANKETDGASGIRDNSMETEQRKIYRFADAIFSGRPKDREYFLGKAINHPRDKIIKTYGSLKPCIHGSDAHSVSKICKPDLNRYNWIKADTTFRGLQQIIHEPEKRVSIQENNPDIKNDYNVIKTVKFHNSSYFTGKEIKLNSGLNAIIGGKSSGKSLLLYKIAQSVSTEEISSRSQDGMWKNPYIGSFIETENFEVRWRNEEISELNKNIGKVTYIPQMYINSLSEDKANNDLQNKIMEILYQDPENARFLNEKNEVIKAYSKEINLDISRLFEKMGEMGKKDDEIKKAGSKDAIEKESKKIREIIEGLLKASNLTQDEELNMQELETKKKEVKNSIRENTNKKEKGKKAFRELNSLISYLNSSLKDLRTGLSEEYIEFIDSLGIKVNQSFRETISQLENVEKEISDLITTEESNITQIDKALTPYHEKLNGLKELSLYQNGLREQEVLLKNIAELEKEKETLAEEINQIKQGVYFQFECYIKVLHEIKLYFDNKNEFTNIVLKADVFFEQDMFEERFLNLFNRRGRVDNLFPNNGELALFDEDEKFIFDITNYLEKLKSMAERILSTNENQLKFKKSASKEGAFEQLFNTKNTKITFDFLKDGDSLNQMSPGKRGLVLLELFLEMSNDKHPILIDQPEDNLDNRTISTDLVDILKKKKDERQIIIVTHNANLVVLTDAENVIVANQDLQLIENEQWRFEYITGALECDFNENTNKLSSKGIKTHVCELLEGGQEAFELREKKYGF